MEIDLSRTPSSPSDRIESLLDNLRKRVPYAAALVTAHDAKRRRHVTVASRNYSSEVVDYVLDTYIPHDPSFRLAAARPNDVLHWDTLPEFRRGPMARGYLVPAGFCQGSSLALEDRVGRPIGSLHVSMDEALVTAATLEVLATTRRAARPIVAAERIRRAATVSARELQVLRLLCAGLTNNEIAAELWVTRRTVATHIEHILRKLGAQNRVQAAMRATALGLVSPDTAFED